MSQINLLKNESEDHLSFSSSMQGTRSPAFYVLIGILILELLVYGFFFFYGRRISQQMLAVEQRGASVDVEISKVDAQRLQAISYQQRLSNLQTLLKEHLSWSKFFSELEKYTYNLVSYDQLQINDGDNVATVSGSVNSYTDLAKLMTGLGASPNIRSVSLQSSGQKAAETGGYKFVLEITFDPRLLTP